MTQTLYLIAHRNDMNENYDLFALAPDIETAIAHWHGYYWEGPTDVQPDRVIKVPTGWQTGGAIDWSDISQTINRPD